MAGKTAAQRRAYGGVYVNLFQKGTLVGARVIRRVPMALAEEMVARRKWRPVAYENGELAGFQPYAQPSHLRRRSTPGVVLPASESMISSTEAEMNAGLCGVSRTLGMPEWKRDRRVRVSEEKYHRIVEPEDAIERAKEKIRIWPELRNVEPGLKPVIV